MRETLRSLLPGRFSRCTVRTVLDSGIPTGPVWTRRPKPNWWYMYFFCVARARPKSDIIILFGGSMISLSKPKSLRSNSSCVTVFGEGWRSSAPTKFNTLMVRLSSNFVPSQFSLGLWIPDVCEDAVHSIRRFVNDMHSDYVQCN